jgi:hypothetical protein
MRLTFTDCATSFAGGKTANIQVEALKSTIGEASFNAPSLTFPTTPIEGMRYSPMGGFPVQYRLTVLNAVPLFPADMRMLFFFETQEKVSTPGVARAADEPFDATYLENVGDDYWAVKGDPEGDPAGDTGRDISKRVVFNSGLAQECTLTFDEPFQTGNPLYKTGQNLRISLIAIDLTTQQPCTSGQLRISISKSGGTFEPMVVKSVGGAQTDNVMSSAGAGKYVFNGDLSGYPVGTYDLFVWGNLTEPIAKAFTIKK